MHPCGRDFIFGRSVKRFANLVDIVNPTHGKIVDAIARNDEEEAAAAMDEHLRYMEYRIELNRTIGS